MARGELRAWTPREMAVQNRIRELACDPVMVGQPWAPELLAAADEVDVSRGTRRIALDKIDRNELAHYLVGFFGDRVTYPPDRDPVEFMNTAAHQILHRVRELGQVDQ